MSKKEVRKDLFNRPDGRFKVEGTVFLGSVQQRKKSDNDGKTSNVVKSVGYKIRDNESGKAMFMEKLEAINLVRKHGVTNATIRPRKQTSRDAANNQISTQLNLNLHPVKDERPFTDGDRLYPIFSLDKNGKILRPVELFLNKEDCSPTLWKLVESEYKKRKPKGPNKAHKTISDDERMDRIERALSAANFEDTGNPFDEMA